MALTPSLPVIWPGQNKDLPSVRCIEVVNMVNRPDRPFIGSTEPQERMGILQIGLLSLPEAGEYAETMMREIAGDIADHFAVDAALRYRDVAVKIYEAPEVGTSIKDEKRSRIITPISVRWRCNA
jgi:hypothetical protein